MPELPEVETIKRYLEKAIVGRKIVGIEILSKKQFPNNPREIIGEKITGVARRGKNLIINLSHGKCLLIHLKLTGQLIWAPTIVKSDFKNRQTRVIISFDKGKLFFNDMRKFGWIKVVNIKSDFKIGELEKLGPEPFGPSGIGTPGQDFTEKYLQQIFQKTSKPVKLVLLDQEKIAGIGNIYANEALWEALINPEKPAKNLNLQEVKKLHRAILLVLKEGIKYGGSSAADETYIKPDGSQGAYQKHFRVYQKNGQKCLNCNTMIKRINLAGRGTFFCPKCQR